MADRSSIEWTDATWNPVRGCTRVSAGCQHCYAERVAARFAGPGQPYEGLIHPSTGGWNGKVRLVPEVLDQPLSWRKPRRIFVNSMSDLFHEAVPDEFIDQVFAVMAWAQDHTFQVLTKRPARMRAYCSAPETSRRLLGLVYESILGVPGARMELSNENDGLEGIQLPNVCLGVSVEDQATADERIPLLLQCPAAVRWVSAEPLLGRVDLTDASDGHAWREVPREHWIEDFDTEDSPPALRWDAIAGMKYQRFGDYEERSSRIDWVVAGGESGPGARAMHPDWARSLRDQCADAGVPFLFKQWGEWLPASREFLGDRMAMFAEDGGDPERLAGMGARPTVTLHDQEFWRAGKKAAGRLLDGVLHDAYPEVRHA